MRKVLGIFVFLCVLAAGVAVLSPHFLTRYNLSNLGRWIGEFGIAGIGEALVIITGGIDVGAKAEIYEHMETLAKRGMAILMISSEMEEVLNMSDRVLVMHEGRIAGALQRDALSEEAVMQLATGGESRVVSGEW